MVDMDGKIDNYVLLYEKNNGSIKVRKQEGLVEVYSEPVNNILCTASEVAKWRRGFVKNLIRDNFGEGDCRQIIEKYGVNNVYRFLCEKGCNSDTIYMIFDELAIDVSSIKRIEEESTFIGRLREVLVDLKNKTIEEGRQIFKGRD